LSQITIGVLLWGCFVVGGARWPLGMATNQSAL
jgi:hypothetical protein